MNKRAEIPLKKIHTHTHILFADPGGKTHPQSDGGLNKAVL